MQFFKLLVAMTAMVSAQHDASKCDGNSMGSNSCCASFESAADCDDNYVVVYVDSESCTRAEAGSSMMSKFYCDPPSESTKQDSVEIDFGDFSDVDYSGAASAAGAGIVTILLLWILTPVIICVCICVCICACSKSCCFAQK